MNSKNDRNSDAAEKLFQLKNEIERITNAGERAKGACASILERLKTDYGCKSLRDAKRKLKSIRADIESRKQILAKAIRDFEKNHTDVLYPVDGANEWHPTVKRKR